MALSYYKHEVPTKSIANPVKLYADLGAAAIKSHRTNELALWSILRTLPSNNCGDIVFDGIGELAKQLIPYGYTERTAYRQLTEANGRLWRMEQGKRRTVIKICGLLTVYRSFSIQKLTLDRHARLVEATGFNSLAKRNAQLYAAIFKPYGVRANPITRETITELTGLSITQQRRYERIAKIKRTPTFEVTQNTIGGISTPVTMTVSGKSRTYTVPRRFGNIYHSRQDSGHKGQVCKAARALTSGSEESLLSDGALLPLRKLFHTSLKALVRYFKGHTGQTNTGYHLVRNKYRYIKGRLEYCLYGQIPLPLFEGVNYDV